MVLGHVSNKCGFPLNVWWVRGSTTWHNNENSEKKKKKPMYHLRPNGINGDHKMMA